MKKIFLISYIFYLPFQLKVPYEFTGLIMNSFIAIFLGMLIFGKNEKPVKMRFDFPLTVFLVIWGFSVIWAVLQPSLSSEAASFNLIKEFKRLITLPLGYLIFSRCIKTKNDVNFYTWIFVLCIICVGFFTLKTGVLGGSNFGDHKRAFGPFGEDYWASDIAGGYLAMFIPFVLVQFFFIKSFIKKMLSLAGFGICCLGLMATYSRGSILALGASFSFVLFFAFKPLIKKSFLYGFFIFICLIVAIVTWKQWVPESLVARAEKTTVEDGKIDKSSQMRLEKWLNGLNVFYENPVFGIGYQQLKLQFGTDPHNGFIQIAAEMGIFGILAFLIFLFGCLKEGFGLVKAEELSLGFGLIGCIIALCGVNMFYSNFFRDTVIGSFWIILGIIAANKRLSVKAETNNFSKTVNNGSKKY